MRSVPGIPVADAADTRIDGSVQINLEPDAEIRWIERLQQRALASTASPVTTGAEAGSWIRRLQRAANDPR